MRFHNKSVWITTWILIVVFFYNCNQSQSQLTDESRKKKVLSMYQSYKSKYFPANKDLTAEDYIQLSKEEKTILVDIRSESEMEVSMIPGAISAQEFEANKDSYRDYKIVAYCTIGYRSGFYAKELREEQFTAYNIIGGVLGWAHAGKQFVNSEGYSQTVHVYGNNWDLLPKGYESYH